MARGPLTEQQRQRRHEKELQRREQAHESKMGLIKAFGADPELKYYLGVLMGSATAVAGALTDGVFTTDSPVEGSAYPPGYRIPGTTSPMPPHFIQDPQHPPLHVCVPPGWVLTDTGEVVLPPDENKAKWMSWAWLGGPGGIAGALLLSQVDANEQSGSPAGTISTDFGPLGFMPDIAKLGGMGFAGFCASVLIFKSIFSGTDLGELLSGVGEIVPL